MSLNAKYFLFDQGILAYEGPGLAANDPMLVYINYSEYAFLGVFGIEALLRILHKGLFFTNVAYFKDTWNQVRLTIIFFAPKFYFFSCKISFVTPARLLHPYHKCDVDRTILDIGFSKLQIPSRFPSTAASSCSETSKPFFPLFSIVSRLFIITIFNLTVLFFSFRVFARSSTLSGNVCLFS